MVGGFRSIVQRSVRYTYRRSSTNYQSQPTPLYVETLSRIEGENQIDNTRTEFSKGLAAITNSNSPLLSPETE